MFMHHSVMYLVLVYLAELGRAESGEVAEGLRSLRISRKYASLVLTRCYRRRFVSRRPYKRGRERGYVYQLSDKGAEWLQYKASHKKDPDVPDREPTIEAEDKRARLDQRQQIRRDFVPTGMVPYTLVMQIVDNYVRAYHSLKQRFDLAILALARVSDERDFARWLYLTEHEKKLRLLEKLHHQEKAPLHESFRKGSFQGLEFVLKLGMEIGKTNTFILTQAALDRILLMKIAGSFGLSDSGRTVKIERASLRGARALLLKDCLSRKQKDEEASQDILTYRYVNERWWDLLPPGSNTPLPPVRGPARGT